ncbi:MAG: ABC transporter permease, partial [Bryobacteraceae bacterium]
MDQLRQDLRYGFRSLRKNPGFTAVAVLSLGLGIGANTAIFSLVNTVMLRLLPVAKPERLVLMTNPASSGVAIDTTEGGVRRLLSYPEFDRLRQHNRVFTGMAAMQSAPGDLDIRIGAGDTGPQIKARGQLVSGEFFPVLGLTPAAGRLFTPADDKLGEKPVAVLSYGFWQREFGRDPSVAG